MIYKYRRGRDHMVVGFTTTYAISTNHTKVASLNPAHDGVHSIQHNVIKFASGFHRVLRFPPLTKRTATI